MLNLTGLPALDVAIGLAFIFFLLATLALTIQEFIAAILGLRARTLEQGLRSMLEDPEDGWKYVDRFYDHPLITSMYRTAPPPIVQQASGHVMTTKRAPARAFFKQILGLKATTLETDAEAAPADKNTTTLETDAEAAPAGKNAHDWSPHALDRARAFFKRTSGPSYISPRSFALVVLDNFAPGEGHKTFFDHGLDTLDELPERLRERLRPLIGGPRKDVENLRANLEAWYDDTMARVSGWYKRKTQIILIVIGVVLVPAINANTIAMAERMWKDDAVRSAVASQAQANASAQSAAGESGRKVTQKLADAANEVDKVVKVGIPMGWRGAVVPHGAGGIATAICGWLLTILAISLGAPFWFDTLSRFSRLRSSGKPETPLPAAGSHKTNERILRPPQVSTGVPPQQVSSASDTTKPGPGADAPGD